MKGILFNTEMVKAILDNRKTVTRRVVKPQLCNDFKLHEGLCRNCGLHVLCNLCVVSSQKSQPYQADDVLYIRETFFKDGRRYLYKANYSAGEVFYQNGQVVNIKWKPAIHMPKEAARIFLRVTDVKVEKLQDITDGDLTRDFCLCEYAIPIDRNGLAKSVWNSTIKKSDLDKYGWDANPYVWCISFERISKEEALKNDKR